MLKQKTFINALSLTQWVNENIHIDNVIAITTSDNPDMNSFHIWTLFYKE